ncbi:tetratricopeptide repeat protein [bacterium]|nr:tetratricopeptide repeat protein [bacterium]
MLKPRKRLVKTKIKEDKLVTYTAKAQTFYDQNKRTLLYGAIGIIVVIAIVIGINITRSSAQEKAAFESLLARDALSRGNTDEALTHVNIILEDYPGTRSAAIAMMIKARIHEQNAELNEAAEVFKKLISDYGEYDYLAFGAYYSLGSIYNSWGEYNEAARFYSTGASKYPKNFNAAYSLLEAALCYKKAGKYEQANRTLRRILTDYSKSRATGKARTELEEIEFMQ